MTLKKPFEIVPTMDTRVCEFCKAYTWWARPRQSKRGVCLDCAGYREISNEELSEAVMLILSTWEHGQVSVIEMERTEPGYDGEGAGPCAGCRRPTRLYGFGGNPLCRECANAARDAVSVVENPARPQQRRVW